MKSTKQSAPETYNKVATVVFIDAGVENYQQLVNGVIPAAEVFVLDAVADGIEQIGQVLQQRQDIDAVHIVSHGAPGCLYLGNTQLSLDTFNRYATQLQQWDVANLLLYGCHVAAGDSGEEFVEKLHRLTGANIAASRTPTGNAALGGNWQLEIVLGQQQPLLAFQPSVMAAYEGILPAPVLGGVAGSTTRYNGSQVAVAPTLTITDPDVGDTLSGATVAINVTGQVTAGESLSIAGQAATSGTIGAINWAYNSASGVMTLEGTASVSTYEAVLRQVTYQNTSATATTAARDIQFTLGTGIYNPQNGHYYDFVDAPAITWTDARDAAATSTLFGSGNQFPLQGYLATITSAEENSLIASKVSGKGWIGASDSADEGTDGEGDWRWVTGPEEGTQFWRQVNGTGTPVAGQYSNWATTYNGGQSLEPNNNDGGRPENYGHMHPLDNNPGWNESGKWNDFANSNSVITGYVVEYGGLENPPPPLQISGTARVTFNDAPQTSQWAFVTRDYQLDGDTDIVAIKKNGTGTGTTEVHMMNADTNYQSWLLQTGTALGVTDNTWDFVKGDYDRDGKTDIFSIQKIGTGTGTTELHILDAKTQYQSFVLHSGTALGVTGDNFDFQGADCNGDGYTDLIAIQKSGTASGRTEVHILDGKSGYQSWQLHAATALAPTDDTWKFQVGDYNGDGITDIVGLKQSNTGTATTEVHVLNGATNYQSFVMQTGTALAETGNNWDFLMDDYNRNNPMGVIGLKESDTGTQTTEAHILNAGVNYQNWLLQTGTVLPPVASSEVLA